MIEMVTFTTYQTATGAIRYTVTCPTVDVDANTAAGCARVDGEWSGLTYWVDNGVPTLRTAMSPTVSGSTISNLPIPCGATIEGVRYTIDDGVLELDPSLPGPYVVTLEAVPYLPYEVTIP